MILKRLISSYVDLNWKLHEMRSALYWVSITYHSEPRYCESKQVVSLIIYSRQNLLKKTFEAASISWQTVRLEFFYTSFPTYNEWWLFMTSEGLNNWKVVNAVFIYALVGTSTSLGLSLSRLIEIWIVPN